MSTVNEALAAYRAAVDDVRRAEYVKKQAAQALYEARQAAGSGEDATVGYADGEPLPSTAFHGRIAYVGEPTKDGRVIEPGKIDWQFGKRIPVTSGFEGGEVVGYAIPSHIEEDGSVMATIYVDEVDSIGSLGIGLDHTQMSINDEDQVTLTAGRLRHVAAQTAEAAAWPGVVVKR